MVYLFGKLSLSLFFVACSIVVAHQREALRSCAARLPNAATLCVIYLVARIAALWVMHKGLGIAVPSDVPGYFEHALRIVHGEIPNRDFSSPYGFLFNYLMAAAVYLHRDPFSILVMLQIGECVGVYLLIRAVVQYTGDAGNGVLLLAIYAANPIIGVNLWLGGQDESLLVLVIGSAALLATSTRRFAVMALPAILFAASKLFSLWILAPLALARNWRERFGMAVGFVLVLGLIKLTGAALISFEFSRAQGGGDQLAAMQTSGNLWYLVTKALQLQVPGYLPTAIVLLSLTVVGAWLWRQSERIPPLPLVLLGSAMLGVCFQTTYRMTSPPYLAPAVAALAALLVIPGVPSVRWLRSTIGLAVWSGLWSFDETFWYRVRDALARSTQLRIVFDLYESVVVVMTVLVLACTLSWAATWAAGDRNSHG
jgi:hypothetical protein